MQPIVEENQIKKVKRLNKRLILLFIYVVSVSMGIFFIYTQVKGNNKNMLSGIKMFSDGDILFCAMNDKLYSYDNESQKFNLILNEPVYEVLVFNNFLFYTNKKGLYYLLLDTSEKRSIVEFGKETIEQYIKGGDIYYNFVREYCNNLYMYENSLYFVYCINIDIMPDTHTVNGMEKWIVLYRFDVETQSIKNVKTSYRNSMLNDISINDLYIRDGILYYHNSTEVYSIELSTGCEKIIYQTPYNHSTITKIDWLENSFNCIEIIENDNTILNQSKIGNYFSNYDMSGVEIYSLHIDFDLFHSLNINDMFFDNKSQTYYTTRENTLISFKFDEVQNYSTIIAIEKNSHEIYNIIKINDELFVSINDGISKVSSSILLISKRNEITNLTKNGKAIFN